MNCLAAIIQEASQQPNESQQNEPQKKSQTEEDDDTSKQATQNYDLHDNEKEVFLFIALKNLKNKKRF